MMSSAISQCDRSGEYGESQWADLDYGQPIYAKLLLYVSTRRAHGTLVSTKPCTLNNFTKLASIQCMFTAVYRQYPSITDSYFATQPPQLHPHLPLSIVTPLQFFLASTSQIQPYRLLPLPVSPALQVPWPCPRRLG